MNYSEHFREKENNELLSMLGNRPLLNFEAQRCLLSEIKHRSMPVDPGDLEDLEQLIKKEEALIRDFHYLPFLGFNLKSDEGVVNRLGSARRVDIFSVLLSIIMMLATVPLTDLIKNFIEEGLTSALPVVGVIVCFATVTYGILLFMRSIDRIMEFWRFEILKRDNSLEIRIGSRRYSVNIDLPAALQVLSGDGKTKLVLVQGENSKPVTLMSTDGGLRLHLTLKHLRDYLVQ